MSFRIYGHTDAYVELFFMFLERLAGNLYAGAHLLGRVL